MADAKTEKLERNKMGETKQCEFISNRGRNKGQRCTRNGRTPATRDGALITVCSQHSPAYLAKQAENRRLRLARKRNAAAAAKIAAKKIEVQANPVVETVNTAAGLEEESDELSDGYISDQ